MCTFGPDQLRQMHGLAQEVTRLRPELLNSDATVGELAWLWGKDHAELASTWRHRLWYEDGAVVAWGWILLPYRTSRSDGSIFDVTSAHLVWQLHPDRPELLDEILDWYDGEAGPVDRRTTVRAADKDARARMIEHGYQIDAVDAGDEGYWIQLDARDLAELPEPLLPRGFRFRTAEEISPVAAAQAHRDAWHPSTFTNPAFDEVQEVWPYRPDLHVFVQAPDGRLAATALAWLDEQNRVAEFEPVGTHQDFRRRGLARNLLLHGMQRARAAGATEMLVGCLGALAYPAARNLYAGVGFRELTRDLPQLKRA